MKKLCTMWLASVVFASVPAPVLAATEAAAESEPAAVLLPDEETPRTLALLQSASASGQDYGVPQRTPESGASPPLSGGVDLKSRYVFDDLYVATPGPVLQGWLSLDVGEIAPNVNCALGTFGSVGLDSSLGREVDLSANCRYQATEQTAVTVELAHYELFDPGVPELNVASVTVSHQGFAVEASYIQWGGGFEDGWSLDASYAGSVSGFDIEAGVLYESGITLPDIMVARLSVSHRLVGPLSANVTGYVPLHRGAGETRTAQVVFGLSYSF